MHNKDCSSLEQKPQRKTRSSNADIEIGRKLQELRGTLKITQTELGEGIGVTFQQVQKYEKGTNRLHAETLWKICSKYNIDINFFFSDLAGNEEHCEIRQSANLVLDEKHIDKKSLNFAKAYLAIKDPNVRKKVFNLLESLSS